MSRVASTGAATASTMTCKGAVDCLLLLLLQGTASSPTRFAISRGAARPPKAQRRQSSLIVVVAVAGFTLCHRQIPRTASYRTAIAVKDIGGEVHSLSPWSSERVPGRIRLVVCPQQCGVVWTPVSPSASCGHLGWCECLVAKSPGCFQASMLPCR